MPTPIKVSTPGSYTISKKKEKKKKKGREKVGRPSVVAKKKLGSSRKHYMATYTAEDMQRAVDLVKEQDYSMAQASKVCGVPRVTLLHRLKGQHTREVGRPRVLTPAEESVLVEVLVLMGKFNYPLTKRHLADVVKNCLDKHRNKTRLKDNRPGKDWISGFLRRHKKEIVVKRAQNIRRSRAAVSPADIREYFSNLEKEVQGVPPTHIFNCDESCMRDDPSAKQAIFMKGVKYPEQVKDHSKTSFSTMYCCSAAGDLLPTMTVFKSQSGFYYDTWGAGAPEGTVFTANKSGWFNMNEYEVWFEKVYLVWLEKKNIPKEDIKVLIADNLGAHISQRVMEHCRNHNIRYGTYLT